MGAPHHWLVLVVLAAALSACGDSGERESQAAARAEDAADDARQRAYRDLGANSDGTDADAGNVDAYDVEDEGNYTCSGDCSGHEAGFQWAQDQDIDDASDCGGNSQSFIEGCEAFAEARQEEADRRAQDEAKSAAEEAEDEELSGEDDS